MKCDYKLQTKKKNERIIKRFKRLTLAFVLIYGSQLLFSYIDEDTSNTFYAQADGVQIPEF